jgi:hypothetical protein
MPRVNEFSTSTDEIENWKEKTTRVQEIFVGSVIAIVLIFSSTACISSGRRTSVGPMNRNKDRDGGRGRFLSGGSSMMGQRSAPAQVNYDPDAHTSADDRS